jgi:Rad3-related DNA helicase
MTDPHLSLSVTELVEFSARTGDLYPESAGGPTAQQGILAHQQIQRQRDADWQREVALKHRWALANGEVTLQGRVDLLNAAGTTVIIEEIKTTLQPSAQLPQGKLALFWAQAQVYAGLYQQLNGPCARVELRLSLSDISRNHVETLTREIEGTAALAETERLLGIYLDWYRQVAERMARNRASARGLQFPFAEYRPGQRALAADIYRTLRDGGALLAEAPTGTGKTVTTLFPACKALGESQVDQVLYLTAKTTSQRQVETTLAAMRPQGLALDSLTLCAREKLCPCRTSEDDPRLANGTCAYTLGFWDRLPAAREDCLAVDALDKAALLAIGHRHRVCPSALSLHLVPWATLIIGDYNYFYDPITQLNSFARNGAARALLVDEVHNLAERARMMYSATLDSQTLQTLAKSASNKMRRKCRHIKRLLDELEDSPPVEVLGNLVEHLRELLALQLAEAAADTDTQHQVEWLTEPEASGDNAGLQIHRFCVVAEHFGDGHRLLVRRGNGKTRVQLLCLDPAAALHNCQQKQKALIGFSATLTPMDFHRRLLGLGEAAVQRRLPYPFPEENLLVLRCDYLDTRWQARQRNFDPLAQLLAAVVGARPGKYLVFFPSYEYLATGHQVFVSAFPEIRTLRQESGSTQTQQNAFLEGFFGDSHPALGFAILGGLFAEGVDFLGDALHGAIVLGTGMPQPSEEQALMAEHFQRQGLNAYQYAYQFPGWTRVLQTAGRVIRSDTDRGVIVLVDPRFARADFRGLLPAHWQPVPCHEPQVVTQRLGVFWGDVSRSIDAATAEDAE